MTTEIKSIKLKSAQVVSLTENEIRCSNDIEKCQINDGCLTITGICGNCFMNIGGIQLGNVTFDGGHVQINDDNGTVMRIGDGKSIRVKTNGDIEIENIRRSKLFVDGKQIEYKKNINPKPETIEDKKLYKFKDKLSFKISDITTQGNSSITLNGNKLDRTLDISVSGSGTCKIIDANLETLDCNVSGRGDIIGQNTICQNMKSTVCGTGDVKNFFVLTKFTGRVSGTGDIKVSVADQCQVNKTISGTGDISIKRKRNNELSLGVKKQKI